MGIYTARPLLLCLALALLAGAGPASAAEAYFVRDGRAQADIVVAEDAVPIVKLAAAELQTYVEKLSGAKPAIVAAPGEGVPAHVYVGRSAATDRLGVSAEGLKHGAYRVASGENWLALVGGDARFAPNELLGLARSKPGSADRVKLQEEWLRRTGEHWVLGFTQLYKQYSRELDLSELDERGTFNAVCDFLRLQGVRWYLPGPLGEVVPWKQTILLPRLNKRVEPDFPIRYAYQYGTRFGGSSRDEVMWQLHMGFNEAVDILGVEAPAHGMGHVIGDPATKAAHPEFYLMRGGRRLTEERFSQWGKPCLSSQGLFEQNVKYVRAMFDLFDAPMVSVMPTDGYVFACECDLCKGKEMPERGPKGSLSDYVWDYVNRVAQEVYKTHPNRKVSCCAYNSYVMPPTKITKLSPNLVVVLCQHRSGFGQDAASRQWWEAVRKGWLAKLPQGSRQLAEYEYYRDCVPGKPSQFMPSYFPHAAAADLRALRGVSLGDFVEVYRGDNDGMGIMHLNLYVTGRFWWDAGQDVDAMLEEYYTLFYGLAREEMKAFIECSEANWMSMPNSPEKINRTLALLEKARQKVPADSVYGRRIALVAEYVRPMADLRRQLATARENVPRATMVSPEKAAVKIDGKLDEDAWQHARNYGLRNVVTGQSAKLKTRFTLFWNRGALYLGIRCEEPDMAGLVVGARRNDDPGLFESDCVEVLLETPAHSYYQLTVGPSGALADLDREKGLEYDWSSNADVAAATDAEGWTVEMRIPVTDPAAVDPKAGVAGSMPSNTFPWYFNVCRQRIRGTVRQLFAYSPTGKEGFHDRLKFAEMGGMIRPKAPLTPP